MTMTPVETLVSEEALYSQTFLKDIEHRGSVMGLIGKLKHEPAIPEPTTDEERNPSGFYKTGVKPSEREQVLEKLFRALFPDQGQQEVHKLLMAVHEELEAVGTNMFDVMAAEEQEARRLKAQREVEQAKREEERSMRACYMCEEKVHIDTMSEVDGEMMCPDCAKEWGIEEEKHEQEEAEEVTQEG